MTTSKYIVLNETKFVSIKGQDNKDFLQGIITNDINKCGKKVIYSCMLTPQGKFLSDFFVIPLKDSFLLEINQKFFDDFITKLKLYKLSSYKVIVISSAVGGSLISITIILINAISD